MKSLTGPPEHTFITETVYEFGELFSQPPLAQPRLSPVAFTLLLSRTTAAMAPREFNIRNSHRPPPSAS